MTECVVIAAIAAFACVAPVAGNGTPPDWSRVEAVQEQVHGWPRTADVIDLDQQFRRWVRGVEQGWRGVGRLR